MTMDKKRSVGIGLYSLLGLCVGVHALYTAYNEVSNLREAFSVIGPAYIILSPGIFMLINWVRITLVVVSSIVTSLFIVIPVLLFLLEPQGQTWVWVALYLTRFFPVFLLSIYSLIYLTRPKVKQQFK